MQRGAGKLAARLTILKRLKCASAPGVYGRLLLMLSAYALVWPRLEANWRRGNSRGMGTPRERQVWGAIPHSPHLHACLPSAKNARFAHDARWQDRCSLAIHPQQPIEGRHREPASCSQASPQPNNQPCSLSSAP